jgi:branched-subunit amino acid aminotransferase/4-amino-4-deoxychorismate lyase
VTPRSDAFAWCWEEEEIRPCPAGLPLSDRGFRYGQHLFESIAIRHGAPLLGADHLALLAASASARGFPFSRALAARLRAFLNNLSLGDGMLRIYLTAGPGAPGAPIKQPGCYLTWAATPFPTLREIEKGCALTLLKKPFLGDGWGVKSGNYAPHLEALQAARDAGADEGIVSDGKGRLLSCAMGNLIVWMASPKSGKELVLFTPASGVGARIGAVLKWVSRQTLLVEQELQITDLRRARALAITNSRLGVMPVATLDGRTLPEISNARELAQHYLYAHGLLGSS